MSTPKDYSYVLSSDDQLFKNYDFEQFNHHFKLLGTALTYSVGNTVIPIYRPQLAVILTTNKIDAWNREKQAYGYFRGKDFLDVYIKAAEAGAKYFIKEFKVTPDTLHGRHAEEYIRSLHDHYYHSSVTMITGWDFVKNSYPLVINNEQIKKFGYYSGLINCADDFIETFPKIFSTYHFNHCIKDGQVIKLKSHRIEKHDSVRIKKYNSDKINSIKESVKEKLKFLSMEDLRKHESILKVKEYDRLLKYSQEFFINLKVPEHIIPIEKFYTNKGNILYTYSLIFKLLYPHKQYSESLIRFLQTIFKQLSIENYNPKNYRKTNIYKKLGSKPQYYDKQIRNA